MNMTNNFPTLYALLVGINEYAASTVNNLGGCENDITVVEQLLCNKFNVPQDNIHKLINTQAKHKAIKTAFNKHLIDQARDWAETGKVGTPPAFLFYYSGHGSRAKDKTGTKPSGMDETIVPHDSRTQGVYDIKDWELGQLLDELTQYGVDNVTVIMDCCHSGSGTRELFDSLPPPSGVRECPPDIRPQPTKNPHPVKVTRGGGSANPWARQEKYVLLAACRNIEKAYEHAFPEGKNGTMTYFLVKELAQSFSGQQPLAYRELYERIHHKVHALYATQTPQCEGDKEREVFGGLRPVRDIFLTVIDTKNEDIWVNGGMPHGLTEGSLLKVYPAETRTQAETGTPLAILYVDEVGAVRSRCVVTEGEKNIPLHASVIIQYIHQRRVQRNVLLDIADKDLHTQVTKRLCQDDAKPYINLIEEEKIADFRIRANNNRLEILDYASLVAELELTDLQTSLNELTQDLAHLVRFHNALELQNTVKSSELAGRVSLAIKLRHFDSTGSVAVDIEPDANGKLVVPTGKNIVLEITNRHNVPLYFTVLEFSYDWSIFKMYPRIAGSHEQLEPGKTFVVGHQRERYAFKLPSEVPEARQVIKVIATLEETDFELLQQGPLKTPYTQSKKADRDMSALGQLFQQAMFGKPYRSALTIEEVEAAAEDKWTTAQLDFRIKKS